MLKDTLKELREKQGLTKKQVAIGVGITDRAYIAYEYGERDVSTETLSKLADFYGVTTDYLLGREPLENPLAGMKFEVSAESFAEAYLQLPEWMQMVVIDAMEKMIAKAKENDKENAKKPPEKPELRITERTGDVFAKREAESEAEADYLKDA